MIRSRVLLMSLSCAALFSSLSTAQELAKYRLSGHPKPAIRGHLKTGHIKAV
jgi:hypothetical protein